MRRRATNVTLPEALLREAREMGINLSQACERGLAYAVAEDRRRRWLEETREAMESWNEHVAEHGLPLAASSDARLDVYPMPGKGGEL